MADEQAQDQPAKKGGLSPTVLIVVAALMIVEFAVVAGFFMLAGGPKEAEAALEQPLDDLNAPVEIQLVSDQFQNMQQGPRVWLWEVDIYMKVAKRNEAFVNDELARRSAEIKAGIAGIIRRASHSQLREPGLETLTRQVTSQVHGIFGNDAEGEPRIDSVIIAKCRGYAADF